MPRKATMKDPNLKAQKVQQDAMDSLCKYVKLLKQLLAIKNEYIETQRLLIAEQDRLLDRYSIVQLSDVCYN